MSLRSSGPRSPLTSERQRSARPLAVARGQRLLQAPFAASVKRKGSGAPNDASSIPLRTSCEMRRRPALHRGFFGPGPRFRATRTSRRRQPAPGRGTVVSPGWSPGSPGAGMPAGRRGRTTRGSLSRPPCPEVSGAHLHPVPPACSALKTPHECAPLRAGCGECKGGGESGDKIS